MTTILELQLMHGDMQVFDVCCEMLKRKRIYKGSLLRLSC